MNLTDTAPRTIASDDLFQDYRPLPGVYDEMVAADGTLRPHWQQFTQFIAGMGTAELARRWEQAGRLIQENGVTYNAHGDPLGRDRRWELDALPLLMPAEEWNRLSAGLAQRARLLNAIAADIYGPQHLVREGLLPGQFVFGHPGFLRACHALRVPRGTYVHWSAAHIARSPEGHWWVVADRTQNPVGAGYAVENRIVISRTLTHVFHQCRVQRLAGFFITLRETLGALGADRRDGPNTVLLSPGPNSPTYFEDAYLARYLGYTLVEGEDLTVRDNRAYLKTLGGLINVDVVLRRVRDADCDPLELDDSSNSGSPGLVHAARRGNVHFANALGTGILETPALMAFLPAICRRLLAQNLFLPSVPTWWCGDRTSLSYVLAHLDQLAIRPAVPETNYPLVRAASLDAAQKEDLVSRIKARPDRFIAQELVLRSTAPVWSEGALRPGHVSLRTFAVAGGENYHIMPGALAHVSNTSHVSGESMFVGHGSKDVWVLSDGPVSNVSLLQPPGTTVTPRRSGLDLPSRVADNMFWLGRHVERAESTTRLLRSVFNRLISESVSSGSPELTALVRALVIHWPQPNLALESMETSGVTESLALACLFDRTHGGSLQMVVDSLARAASIVRDRLSLDSWRILSRIDDDLHPGYPLGVVSLSDVLPMLNQVLVTLSAFSGVATENMTRGPGWQFLDLGRRVERALSTIGLLRNTVYVVTPYEHALLEALLEIADSAMTYRSRYATNLQVSAVLDLLMIDETNPRSIGFQLAALARHVEQLPRQQSDPLLSPEQRLVISMLSTVRLADMNALTAVDETHVRTALDQLLERLSTQLRELARSISHKYLVHAGPAHQISEILPG
ncbi:MAG: circularly permuted type 2 ATP-grasp protein [Pirellulales bacterium]